VSGAAVPLTDAAVPALRLVRAMETMLTAALLGSIAFVALRPIDDPDLWWHLAAGRRILDGGGVPWTDAYSYIAQGREWIAYSWLAEVLFASVEQRLGLGALVPLAALLFAATFAVVFRTCRATGARHLPALLATTAAALAALPCRTVRPHLLSFLCMALCCHWLLVDQQRPSRRLWLLVPTVVLWANTHILFPFAFLVLAFQAAAGGRAWWRGGERLVLVAATGAATLLTPYGWHLVAHLPVMAGQPVALGLVSEFQTPSLHQATGLLLTGFCFTTLLVLILSPARADVAELGKVFVFALLAYSMARNIPFLAVAAAPVLARHLNALLPTGSPAPEPGRRSTLHAALAVHAGLLAAVGIGIASRTASLWPAEEAIDRRSFPVEAVRFLHSEPVRGRLLNDFNWGGYLIGNLYPRYQVAMDGRTQVYGEETLRQYRALIRLEPGWRDFLIRCDPDLVLWPKDEPLVRVLELLPGWRRLYEDELAIILVRDAPPARRG
jgi:hypothetical protein